MCPVFAVSIELTPVISIEESPSTVPFIFFATSPKFINSPFKICQLGFFIRQKTFKQKHAFLSG